MNEGMNKRTALALPHPPSQPHVDPRMCCSHVHVLRGPEGCQAQTLGSLRGMQPP